jgi:hypothetical protein
MSRAAKTRNNALRECARQFPLELEITYRCLRGSRAEGSGTGKTREISSLEIRFTTESPLRARQRIEIAMNWPAKLNENCHIKLVMSGRVVRSDGDTATATIERYEFRTRGRSLGEQRGAPPSTAIRDGDSSVDAERGAPLCVF